MLCFKYNTVVVVVNFFLVLLHWVSLLEMGLGIIVVSTGDYSWSFVCNIGPEFHPFCNVPSLVERECLKF